MEKDPSDAPYASSSRLARNTVLNLIGQGAPLLVALFAIPILITQLGSDRFGVLAIAWVFLGYFSFFDLGMSRALTQLVSARLGEGRDEEIPPLVWTALLFTFLLGLLGSLAVALLARWVVLDVLTIPVADLRADSVRAFYMLAISIPVVISTAALRGILEARQRFDIINALRIPMGIFTFAGPLLVLPFSGSLFAIVAVLVAGRFAAWAAHLYFGLRAIPGLLAEMSIDMRLAGMLLRFGGWMTVSNVVSPIMVYMDRFIIGAMISVTAVAYYTTPWEVVTKIFLISAAISGVTFPAFGFWYSRDRNKTSDLLHASIKFTMALQFPWVLAIVLFAQPGLELWVGATYADAGYRPMQILAIGVMLNGMAVPLFAFLQGIGRPDLTAKVHLVELPFYLVAMWILVPRWGIAGAAVAWSLRIALDLGLLLYLSERFLPASRDRVKVWTSLAFSALLLVPAMLPSPVIVKWVMLSTFLLVYGGITWRYTFRRDEKLLLVTSLKRPF